MTNTATITDPALILAGIIRQADPQRTLGADVLAEAILAHRGSRWGPAATAATPEAGYELIPDDGDPEKLPRDAQQVEGRWWVPRFGCDSLATVLKSVQPATATPWPELPEKPQEPAAIPAAAPAWPEISDGLISILMRDLMTLAATTIWDCATGHKFNPVPEARARLREILELAAKDGAK